MNTISVSNGLGQNQVQTVRKGYQRRNASYSLSSGPTVLRHLAGSSITTTEIHL